MNAYLFCVIKDAYDSIRIIKAENILEYRIGETVYKKAKVENEHFFIKQILTGELTLYERESIPSDYKFAYYLKKKNQQGYLEICPNESYFKIIGERNSSYNRDSNNNNELIFVSDNSIEKFKLFINDYFRACEKVRNMVNAEIYSINDIPAIVRAYNELFINN
jgi:hypothetical protein